MLNFSLGVLPHKPRSCSFNFKPLYPRNKGRCRQERNLVNFVLLCWFEIMNKIEEKTDIFHHPRENKKKQKKNMQAPMQALNALCNMEDSIGFRDMHGFQIKSCGD